MQLKNFFTLPLNKNDLMLWCILLSRAIFLCFFIFSANSIVNLGTSPSLVCIGGILGLFIGTTLSNSPISLKGFLTSIFLVIPLYYIFTKVACYIPTAEKNIFSIYSILQHLNLIALVFWIVTTSTWFFWKYKQTITIEIITLFSFCIFILSDHHGYNFNRLPFINKLAWQFGLSDLEMLIYIVAAILISVITYFLITTASNKTSFLQKQSIVKKGAINRLSLSVLLATFSIFLFVICTQTFLYHYKKSENLLRNGVGDENTEGLSPLDFQSGLGTSHQPVALVRLDSDYIQNPTTPMLYFRETATSKFNGKEMVIGDHKIDSDINYTSPKEQFVNKSNISYDHRIPIVQSIYFLTQHKNAFAIDYPLNINLLKIPKDNNKFLMAYKAYSMAPAYSIFDLRNATVGNPEWSPEIYAHYTETTADPRYKELAEKIAGNAPSKLSKAIAIIDYLNRNVIYTLTPAQEIKEGEDPISTFLFGDLRGYCVHFAHAINYMFRSLDIPTRIATGYATDLSQAKDGHILLRMNDRHAWAEVYLDKLGWIPFDLAPQNVESHAEAPVDMTLLEELMDIIGPDEEILPEEDIKDEKSFKENSTIQLPKLLNISYIFLVLLVGIFSFKIYLLYSWHLPSTQTTKLRRGFRSILLHLHDCGFRRYYGETNLEFQTRISKDLNRTQLSCSEFIDRLKFDRSTTWINNEKNISEYIFHDLTALKTIPLKKRLIGFLNIFSAISFLGRNKF